MITKVRFSVYLRYLILLYTPILILLGSIGVVGLYRHIPIKLFFSDPAALGKIHPLAGFISNIGVLLWAFCTAICLFSAFILYITGKKNLLAFIFCAGIITLILMLDDFFMIHEFLGPRYFHINEKIIYIFYMLLIFLFLLKFIKKIIYSRFILLIASLFFFTVSVLIDVIPNSIVIPGRLFFEDGFKLLGITGWFGYFVNLCFYEVRNNAGFNEKRKVVSMDKEK